MRGDGRNLIHFSSDPPWQNLGRFDKILCNRDVEGEEAWLSMMQKVVQLLHTTGHFQATVRTPIDEKELVKTMEEVGLQPLPFSHWNEGISPFEYDPTVVILPGTVSQQSVKT